ncbi:MAG: GAF domain-containing protein [Verrucomicrobiae bacterium]|nr:GAF domain-containing protein [Verrucomicrobiae bacterium]NNJ87366.1 GAF domain-containing protein [Akkermansiaceae bacterium]
MNSEDKKRAYQRASEKVMALVSGEQDEIARMASLCSVLAGEIETYFWAGFYRLLDGELVIGPYQGTPGCLRIAVGQGVCGASVQRGETIVVEDVHQFPGHIACDSRSRSEIVVPVWNSRGDLLAVFDVDSEKAGAFDQIDRQCLESILEAVFATEATPCQHRG